MLHCYMDVSSSYDDHNPAVILQGYDKTCAMKWKHYFTTASINVQEMFLEIVIYKLLQCIDTGCPKKNQNANSALNLKPLKISMDVL